MRYKNPSPFIIHFSVLLTAMLVMSAWQGLMAQTTPSTLSDPQLQVTLLSMQDTSGLSDMDRMNLPRRVILKLNTPGTAPDMQVRLGSQPGQNDIGQRHFPPGVSGQLPNGTSLTYSGELLTLDLGTFSDAGHFHLTVVTPDNAPLTLLYSEFQ